MNKPCVGFIEFTSIAKGMESVDALLKKAEVRILVAQTISSGKYIVMFDGEVDEVKSSFTEGLRIGAYSVVDSFVLPNIHPAIIKMLKSQPNTNNLNAIGILETTACATCIEGADCALKTASVELVKIHLAKGIAGNAYFVINGEVDNIETAMIAATRIAKRKNTLIEQVVISQVTPEIIQAFRPALQL
ncbi:BMC domain-containing protein [Candidatus Uabimicrobium amorphum]|uniref:Propanediol utilization: polyhedral bodies pduT n=1 Tax=Uabimicrobium amorphum TaxID=2596890 RepID=A0A5S9II10_UABAM|nr:BMC domain-containing protein [Candidatus Uabimicrobium amorphum]BBM81772.1 propanediol utilization: polyhedral bodies pduT [Candidatus Uabimicrobium amorphum]